MEEDCTRGALEAQSRARSEEEEEQVEYGPYPRFAPRSPSSDPHSHPLPNPLRRSLPDAPSSPYPLTNLTSSPHDLFLSLARLPGRTKPIPGYAARRFTKAAGRLAEIYSADPSESALLHILALVKVGLVPAVRQGGSLDRLEQYPQVSWPEEAMGVGFGGKEKVVSRMVESGRLSSAARVLGGESKIADITEETLAALESKHPVGETSPFGPTIGPTQGLAPNRGDIQTALESFRTDVAPGVSGWTVPLLRLASRSPAFLDFLTLLTGSVSAGTAPGRSMLCTSRLTPLAKTDGGIRPIACGELIYRLITKTLLRKAFKPDFLEKYQLGVSSKGGVEPIVRTIERALAGTLDQRYTHLTSVDATNAFNAMYRKVIATATKRFAPALYRLAKWAYNDKSDLVVSTHAVLESSQGVRQGDPLGPLLFSLGLRLCLPELSLFLGPNRRIVCYLDDIYVLSTDDRALFDLETFFSTRTDTLTLNMRKCKTVSLDDIRSNGFELLGSMIGSSDARRVFLNRKIDAELVKLATLKPLPHHHAHLLLSSCFQQDLRHLQRSLRTDDIIDVWDRLDNGLWDEVKRIRDRQCVDSEGEDRVGQALCRLPARMGGLGVYSYRDCAPLAYASANETADVLVDAIFDLESGDEEAPKSQKERCAAMWDEQANGLMVGLNDWERKTVTDNGTTLGRRWLTTIPYFQPLRLADYEVSTGYHLRTLVRGSKAVCRHCGDENRLGHDDVCMRRNRWTVRRHDAVKTIIANALATIESTDVRVEPRTLEGRRRNDISIRGRGISGTRALDYDIKIYSLHDADSLKTTTLPPADCTLTEHSFAQAVRFLNRVGKTATRRAPEALAEFRAIVMSTGGLVARETADEIGKWKKELGEWTFEKMMGRISLELLKSRARLFEV